MDIIEDRLDIIVGGRGVETVVICRIFRDKVISHFGILIDVDSARTRRKALESRTYGAVLIIQLQQIGEQQSQVAA